ncbi:MAG: RES domain-containing protein [Parvularculaceae bacterium]|nr:RES domain-containing protein [Parvularculaceae bacterium]
MRFTGFVWRAHNPEWSWDPESGEGARLHGGRFNPKGVAALYTSLDVLTAIQEASPLGRPFSPITLCQYEIDCDALVDMRTASSRRAAGVSEASLDCPAWRAEMLVGRSPESHLVAARLIAGGAAGLIVRSYAPGADGFNLVLWRWSKDLPHRVRVIDPEQRLPKDRSSWRRKS